jgi:hypothetical protein
MKIPNRTIICCGMMGIISCLSPSLHASPLYEPVPIPGTYGTSAKNAYDSEFTEFESANNLYSDLTVCPEAVEDCYSDESCDTPCDTDPASCRKCKKNLMDRCFGPAYRGAMLYPDMPPHVPYFPINNGYYYFRPYNYTHIEKQRAEAVELGLNSQAPYGSGPFDEIYHALENSYDLQVDPLKQLYPPRQQELPNIQDILNTP